MAARLPRTAIAAIVLTSTAQFQGNLNRCQTRGASAESTYSVGMPMQLAKRNEMPKLTAASHHERPNEGPPTDATANTAAAVLMASARNALRIARRSYL